MTFHDGKTRLSITESEKIMTGEQERIDKLTAAELLVTADRASHTMVSTGGSTRVVLLVYVLIGSTVLSLADVISGTAILWLAALIIPVLLVQFFFHA
ncbi:MAG: hypothetical protein ACTH2A_00885 [Glutamicibacter ardleyensis]